MVVKSGRQNGRHSKSNLHLITLATTLPFTCRGKRGLKIKVKRGANGSEARGCGFDTRRAYHSSLPKSPHFPMLAFNEITDF